MLATLIVALIFVSLLIWLAYTIWVGMFDARRYKRLSHGRCEACGYDLRSTPRICPECGRFVPIEDDPHELERKRSDFSRGP